MKTNRRQFLQLAAGAAAAVGLGVKSKSGELTFEQVTPGTTQFDALDASGLEAVEVAGIPIYLDPYCPTNKIYLIRRDPKTHFTYDLDLGALRRWYKETDSKFCQMEERHLALVSLAGAVKTHGELPTFGIVTPARWVKMKTEYMQGQLAFDHAFSNNG